MDHRGAKLVAESSDALGQQARWLLSTVAELAGRKPLQDGSTIDVGWAVLSIVERNSEFVLCEPDFPGDPFRSQHPDVTVTLMVLSQQKDVLARVGVEGVPTRWSDKIVLAKGCLSAKRLYLERKVEVVAGDSGWYVGLVDEEKPAAEYEARYAYQLLTERPELAQALALPHGYMVVFSGSAIEAVLDPANQDVWSDSEVKH
jgi:hypothetical protein